MTEWVKSLVIILAFIATLFCITDVYGETTTSTSTTCTENALGDQTCVTTTTTTTTTSIDGTTTGNVLTNSNFKHSSNNNYGTTGWTVEGDIGHGHNSTGGTTHSGQDTTVGTLAMEGNTSGKIYQEVDLVDDDHLTQSQVNQGFTSTMSASVWFWNQ